MAGIRPWYTGQLMPLWVLTLTIDGGATVVDLTAATAVVLRFGPLQATAPAFTGAGSGSVLSPPTSGQIQYALVLSDVAAANIGRWQVQVTAIYPAGPLKTDPILWELLASV